MRKFLVPTDFSDCARPAIDFAANLARRVSGQVYLLHVIENDDSDGIPTSGEWSRYIAATTATAEVPYMIGLLRETKAVMETLKSDPVLADIPVADVIEVGIPGTKINHAAEKYDVDMIIMGTHGAKGFKEMFVGSNAEKVVQFANRPVLTIKEKVRLDPDRIIFASDFSDEADRIFGTVKSFAAVYGAAIHLLKVTTPDNFESVAQSRKKINRFRQLHGMKDCPFTIFNDYKKETGILHFANDINADLIAVGTHGRHGLSRLFNPSISEELVNHAPCPVMTVNFGK
jgi:nucleotide-binding universal stress UspA family protein